MADIIKGDPVRVLSNKGANMLSDTAVDCRGYNAISVTVFAIGSGPSATISIEGSDAEGGNYIALPDPNASQAITANEIFDVVAGSQWVKVRIASYSAGTFTVIVTPYVSPGTANVQATISGGITVTSEPSGGGSVTTFTHTQPNVTTTTGAVLAANTSRLYAMFVNDSDTVIYLKIGAAAVANQGIRLNPNGGAYEMSAKMGNLSTVAINAIHAGTGNKVLLVTEAV